MKIGDTVIMDTSRYGNDNFVLLKITDETPKFWKLSNGSLADKKDGKIRGSSDGWYCAYIEEYTGELKKRYELCVLQSKARNLVEKVRRNIDHFPVEVLKSWIEFNTDMLEGYGKKDTKS